jgi:hypothetical protein
VDRIWSSDKVVSSRDPDAAMAKLGIGPDFRFGPISGGVEILFVHRKLGDGDAYFVNNQSKGVVSGQAHFRVTGTQPELWNAITGKSTPLSYRTEGNHTVIWCDLAPEAAQFVVFRKPALSSSLSVAAENTQPAGVVDGNWKVAFQPGRGAPASATMSALKPLNENADAGIKYFSGIAAYTTSFALPKKAKAGAPLWIDLGKVGDVAEVRVNGKMAGTVWFAPNRVDIGKLVKKGSNTLEVRVANLWVNRLIGDKQPGAEKVTFTAAPTYKADAPLRPSGLIGPVTLEY